MLSGGAGQRWTTAVWGSTIPLGPLPSPLAAGWLLTNPGCGDALGCPGSNGVRERGAAPGETISLSVFVVYAFTQAFPFPPPCSCISLPCCSRGTPYTVFKKKKQTKTKQQPILRLFKLVNPLNSTTERGLKMKVWKGNTSSTLL